MKIIIFSCAIVASVLASISVNAQNARDASVRFLKGDRPGMVADYSYSDNIVGNALKVRLATLGKSKSQKGFAVYQGVEWPEIGPGHMDVYTKVDGDDKHSTVFILVSKGYDNYISTATDPEISTKVKAFLDGLIPAIQIEQRRANIEAQEEVVRQTEKTNNGNKKDLNKLISERDRMDKKIEELKRENDKSEAVWTIEKTKLEQMKSEK